MHPRRLNSLMFFLMMAVNSSALDIDVEKLFDGEIEVEEQSVLIEYLEQLQQSPLNVNNASAKELSVLPWLSPIVAARIVQYRHEHGDFKKLADIQNVRGVKSIYDNISPFLTTGKAYIAVSAQGRHRMSSRYEDSKAYQEHIYAGTKEKSLNRFKASITDYVQLGLLFEKDAGEKAWNDLFLGNVVVNLPMISTTIMGGHFSAEFGAGLVFAGPYRMLKGGDPIAPAKQQSRGLLPYLSTAENYAFYGIGVTTRLNRFDLHAFTSRQKKDARIEENRIISIPETGLHRTSSEIAIQDQLTERVTGLAVETALGQWGYITAMWQGSDYDREFPKGKFSDYYDFAGTANHVFGLNADLSFRDLNFFGEVAQCKDGGRALLAGMWYDLSPVEVITLFRQYDKNFNNFYANGFGERTDVQNETGFYVGVRYRLKSHSLLNFYFDQWRSPWLQTFIPMPSSGYEMMLSWEHKLSSLLAASIQFRNERKDDSIVGTDSFGNSIRFMVRPQRSKIRFQIDYDTQRSLLFRTRLELSSYSQHEKMFSQAIGTLLYQDIRWQPAKSFYLQTRWTLFDTQSYEQRFYQFENDMPGVMRLKMLNGRGKRWYVMFVIKVKKYLALHLKYENLYIDDHDTIGSGNDIIYSQYENIFSAQLDWRF